MTTRNLTAEVGSLMAGETFGLRVLAQITTANTTLHLQTGIGYLRVGTIDYLGVGHLGGVERVRDVLNRFAPGVKLWLSAASSELFSEVLNEALFNKDVKLYRAYLKTGPSVSTTALVNTPELWFRGKMNEIQLHRGDPERGDYVEIECRIRLKKEAKSSYYTREDLWLTYSGDTGFNFHAQIPGFKGLWGQQPTYYGDTVYPQYPPGPRLYE